MRRMIDRRVIELSEVPVPLPSGRPLVAPPGLPPERLAALRRAFDKTMQDADFLAEAKRLGLDIRPISGENLQKVIAEVAEAAPADVIARVNDLHRSVTR